MPPETCAELRPALRRQQGTSLIEALITMIILAILGIGLAYVSGRASVSQRFMNSQNLAVSQMRSILQTATSANCTSATTVTIASNIVGTPCSLPAAGTSYSVKALGASGATVASGNITITAPSISTATSDANAQKLLGGQITIAP